MSLEAMKQCWEEDFPDVLDGVAPALVRAVALAIADVVNAKNDDQFYGSVTQIAVKARVGRRTAQRVVGHLTAAGVLVELEVRPGLPTRYRWIAPTRGVASTERGGRVDSTRQKLNLNSMETQRTANAVPATPRATLPSEAVTCPVKPCGASPGQPCQGNGRRYREGSHVERVAHVLTRDFWDAAKAQSGHPPAVNFCGLRQIVTKLLNADWSHTDVARAIAGLHSEGRVLTAQSIDARLRGAQPPTRNGRPAGGVVAQMHRVIAQLEDRDAAR